MSKQCPHCKSYNTEFSVGGNVEYAAKTAGRILACGAAFIAGNLLGPVPGMAAGVAAAKGSEEWTKGAKHYHCCNCGRDF